MVWTASSGQVAGLSASKLLNEISVLSLRCFVAVVETESFSSAARQLRIAPSTVTKHIKLIERAVQVALVHRTTRRISITDAGARFYEQCLAIMVEVDRATESLAQEQVLRGQLRVSAPPAFASGIFGVRLPEFLALHTGLVLDVMVSSNTPDLVRSRIDVAITFGEVPPTKLTHTEIISCSMVLCASPDYLATAGVPPNPTQLVDHACLSARFGERAEGWPMQVGTQWQIVKVNSRLLSDNGELLRTACLAGAGIGLFYEFHVRDDLMSGRLIEILADYKFRPKNLYATIPNHRIVRPQARAFLTFLEAICRVDGL